MNSIEKWSRSLILMSLAFILPSFGFAQEPETKEPAVPAQTDSSKGDESNKAEQKKQAEESKNSEAKKETAFIDRDGDGIQDGMEHRFRRGKRHGKNDRDNKRNMARRREGQSRQSR